jgi:hypothetical protein
MEHYEPIGLVVREVKRTISVTMLCFPLLFLTHSEDRALYRGIAAFLSEWVPLYNYSSATSRSPSSASRAGREASEKSWWCTSAQSLL